MRPAISATPTAALALLVLLAACDKAKHRPVVDTSKPLTVTGAPATAPVAAAAVGLAPISGGLPLRPQFPAFYLDRINTAKDPLNYPATIGRDAAIEMTGFGYDVVAKAPAKGIDLDIDGKLYGAVYGDPRPDVAASKNIPALTATGYHMTLPAGVLAAGPHKVTVRVVSADGAGFYQSPTISFTVQ